MAGRALQFFTESPNRSHSTMRGIAGYWLRCELAARQVAGLAPGRHHLGHIVKLYYNTMV